MTSTSCGLTGALLSVGLLSIAMASIQSGASLTKSMFPLVGVQGTTALRLFFVALVLLPLLRPWRKRLSPRSLRSVMIYGITLGSMNLLFYLSVCTMPLGITVALEFTGPLLVAILSSRRLLNFPWIGLVVFGIWLLLLPGNSAGLSSPIDIAYALGTGVCWTLYILFGQRAGADHSVQSAALGALVVAVLAAPIGVAHVGADLLDPALTPLALGVAVLSTTLPYTLRMVALIRLPAHTFGTPMSIKLTSGALSGLLSLGERLSPTQWLAIGAVVLAPVGTTLSVKLYGAAPVPPTKD